MRSRRWRTIGCFVGFLGGVGESGFDVAVGDATGAQVARDPEFSLAADFRALTGELFREALVVDHFGALQTVHYGFQEFVVFRSPAEQLLHFVDGIGSAHERADRGFIELCFGFDLARLGEHEKKMK